jgi:hypothetical protein
METAVVVEQGRDMMVSLVRGMVEALVDEPGAVEIQSTFRDGLVTVHVTTARGDVGKLIGKQGRTARSMRTILACASMKSKVRCELNILEYSHKAGAA